MWSRQPRAVLGWVALTAWLWLLISPARAVSLTLPLTWLWANPWPHGNNISDLAYNNGLYVAVAENGQLYTTLDLDLWVRQPSHTTKDLRAVTFFGPRTIISTAEGSILYSDTGTNFSVVDLGTSDWLEAVAASSNLVVAVGDNAAIYTSPDGVVWQRQPPPFSNWLRGVAYGVGAASGLFVVVGESGLIATSPDGVRWQIRSSGTTADLNKVTWLTERFWAVGAGGDIRVSTNGVNWIALSSGVTNDLYAVAGNASSRLVIGDNALLLATPISTPPYYQFSDQLSSRLAAPAPAWTYYAGLWDGSEYLVGGRTGVMPEGSRTNLASTNFTWTLRNKSLRNWFWDIVRIPGLYTAVGDLATVMTSNDGANWNLEATPNADTNTVYLGIAGTTEALVAVGNNGHIITSPNLFTNVVVTNTSSTNVTVTTNSVSTLGLVWRAVSPAPTANDLQGVGVLSNLWVAAGGAGTILTSTDTTNWTVRSTPTAAFLSGVAPWAGGWVVVGDGGTILTSTDGVAWTQRSSGLTNWLYRVRALDNQLVAVGENGTLLTSTNGLNWTTQPTGVTNWLNDVAFLDGVYYVVGNQGTLLLSSDAIHWTNTFVITPKSLTGVVAGTHAAVAIGLEGTILRLQSGPVIIDNFVRNSTTNFFTVSGLPGQPFTLDRSPDLTNWTTGPFLQFLDYSGLLIYQDAPTNAANQQFYRATLLP